MARVCLGAIVEFLCSYITLPLYALVSQMGSQMKRSIFDEQTSKAIKKWHLGAKKKNVKESGNSPTRSPTTSPKASSNSGMNQPHCLKSNGHEAMSKVPSKRRSHLDHDIVIESEMQPSTSMSTSPPTMHQIDLLSGSPK